MKLCKRSIIVSSLLAVLAISSAYAATPVQSTENTDTAMVDMDYSNLPELKKSIESATPAMVQSTLAASKGKPTKDKPVYSTVTMTGNRVVSVKTYKTKEEQEKAMLKERERLDKVSAERRAKRKNETRADMLKGLKAIPMYPPVNETRALQSEIFSQPFGRQLDLRLVEAYTQDYDKAKPGDIYVYADYVDYTSKQLLGEKDGTTAISAMILRTIMRKDENKAFSIDVNAYFINPTTHTISISRSEDVKGINIKKSEIAETVFKLPTHQLQPGDPQYEIAKLMYQDLTSKKFD
ncbi:MAG: hypothetical protein E6974_06880 [Veillonella sp.]|nr:hypothetical protein [Veillonella sp.]MDU1397027.1 hypothetical protein [Veillonella parvula]